MKSKDGFSFRLTEEAGAGHLVGGIGVAIVLFLGLFACLWVGLGLSGACSPLPLAVAGIIYCVLGNRLPHRALAIQIIAVAAMVIYPLTVSGFIIDGWNVVMNQVFGVLELRLGYIFPRYETAVTGAAAGICAQLFLGLPTVLLGLLSARTVSGRGLWCIPTAVLAAGLWAMGAAALYPPDGCWVLLALGLCLCAAWRLSLASAIRGSLPLAVAVTVQVGLLLALCAVPALLWNAGGEVQALEVRRSAERWVHHARYEDTKTTLPEGNFTALGDFAPGDGAALTVTMEEPKEIYLRGYVGEEYTGSGWAALRPEDRAGSATLFAWLHERDFYGQEQYSRLCQALGVGGSLQEVSVSVADACTGWRYAPYGLATADIDPRQIGDADWRAEGLRGETEYSYQISDRSVGEYEQAAELLTAAHRSGSPQVKEYLGWENAYREFVYANYLMIPEEAREAIGKVFAGLTLPQEGRVSFSDAQMVVRTYLSSVVSYNETPPAIEQGRDFVSGFLLDTREGYSVHYATAAALMFRYLGVPARYVEGWYIPAATAGEMTAGEPAELDQKFAHAWVEVYRDGVGFVPFEITPPYTDPMEQHNLSQGGNGGAEDPPLEVPPEPLDPWQIFGCALAGMFLLLAALVVVLVARRAHKRKRLALMWEAPDPSVAVSNMTTWVVHLLGLLGLQRENGSLRLLEPALERQLGPDAAQWYLAAVEVQRKAVFSRDGASDEDRSAPKQLLIYLEDELRRRSSFPKRLRLRWVECII